MTTKKKPKIQPAWGDVKVKLAMFDRASLLALVQDLYALSKTNQSFLHARFSLGTDSLAVYKKRIHDALFANWNKPVRVAEAKKAISEYRRAIGQPEGLLELHVFWCETASGFSMEFGYADEGYFNALLHQFEAALKQLGAVAEPIRRTAIARLKAVRDHTEVATGCRMKWAGFWNAPARRCERRLEPLRKSRTNCEDRTGQLRLRGQGQAAHSRSFSLPSAKMIFRFWRSFTTVGSK